MDLLTLRENKVLCLGPLSVIDHRSQKTGLEEREKELNSVSFSNSSLGRKISCNMGNNRVLWVSNWPLTEIYVGSFTRHLCLGPFHKDYQLTVNSIQNNDLSLSIYFYVLRRSVSVDFHESNIVFQMSMTYTFNITFNDKNDYCSIYLVGTMSKQWT